jgi:hypothetical protein
LAYLKLADCLKSLGSHEAEDLYRRNLGLLKSKLGDHDPRYASAVVSLATVLARRKSLHEAELLASWGLNALKKVRQLRLCGNPSLLTHDANLLGLNLEEQHPGYKVSFGFCLQVRGSKHLDVARALQEAAIIALMQANYSNAEQHYRFHPPSHCHCNMQILLVCGQASSAALYESYGVADQLLALLVRDYQAANTTCFTAVALLVNRSSQLCMCVCVGR